MVVAKSSAAFTSQPSTPAWIFEVALFKDDRIAPDLWRRLNEDDDVPQEGHVIVALAPWQKLREVERLTNKPLGILLPPGTPVDAIVEDLPRLSLVALPFPKFTDGRAYSMAHKLRDNFNFEGEIRAVGDVLFDQLQLMRRCGFDAFEISDASTLRLLENGRRPHLEAFYQPGLGPEAPAGTRPWTRRAV